MKVSYIVCSRGRDHCLARISAGNQLSNLYMLSIPWVIL